MDFHESSEQMYSNSARFGIFENKAKRKNTHNTNNQCKKYYKLWTDCTDSPTLQDEYLHFDTQRHGYRVHRDFLYSAKTNKTKIFIFMCQKGQKAGVFEPLLTAPGQQPVGGGLLGQVARASIHLSCRLPSTQYSYLYLCIPPNNTCTVL